MALQGDIERLKAAADKKTGFEQLDKKSGGLYAGLYVLAAISSLGKTTFALQIADNLAAAGHDVLFFSLEQSRLELISKSFARILEQSKRDRAATSLQLRKGENAEQLAFAAATRVYVEEGKDLQGKGFDPRKLLAPGVEAIKATVREKMTLFGSVGKA